MTYPRILIYYLPDACLLPAIIEIATARNILASFKHVYFGPWIFACALGRSRTLLLPKVSIANSARRVLAVALNTKILISVL